MSKNKCKNTQKINNSPYFPKEAVDQYQKDLKLLLKQKQDEKEIEVDDKLAGLLLERELLHTVIAHGLV